jgi:hypothetical protein
VNEEYKVIFFQVAKAASTEWKRFFSRLQGEPYWCAGYSNDSIHKSKVNKLKHLSDYTIEEAQDMMTNSAWKKAIFTRHPKPRILSAFLDKAVGHSEHFVDFYCPKYSKHAGGILQNCIKYHQDFHFFVQNFTATPYIQDDMHWRSIFSVIDEKWWPFIDFVGYMDNLNENTKTFLSSIHSSVDGVSAWDRIGRFGWNDKDTTNCTIASQSDGQFMGTSDKRHSTKARDQMLQYYTPFLEDIINERYSEDLNNPFFHFNTINLFDNIDQE